MTDIIFDSINNLPNSISTKAPHLLTEWDSERNHVSPMQITYGSNKKYWWKCIKRHEWSASPNNRFNGSNCPFCSSRKFHSDNSLAVKAPHLIKEWHPNKNGKRTPYDVLPTGNKKFWWLCEKGHEWETAVGGRYAGNGCPDCSGRRPSATHNFAYQHPDLAVEWHPHKNDGLTPDRVTPRSRKLVWWLCKNNHEWKCILKDRARLQHKCPYCDKRQVSEEFNLAVKRPELIKEWHPDNTMSPNQVMPSSNMKVKWICKWKHEWVATIGSRARGHGCPKCVFRSSRLEVRIFCELKHLFHDTLWQHKVDKREVDIFIPSFSLGIEVDGWYWHIADDRVLADRKKEIILEENNINLIRVADERIKFDIDLNVVSYKDGEDEHSIVPGYLI